ncbi:hypothetical protein EJ08DRAFT_701101 [Tothia fuscella]|uniref:Uncharacterized protein n=1 Tax=Tothia fuscella TaxID=1048955 RepID=A0A9P4NJ87_9PEZI|nr:hypothetical protein EJ08DRAFT_701101 [Tothia fuscella]
MPTFTTTEVEQFIDTLQFDVYDQFASDTGRENIVKHFKEWRASLEGVKSELSDSLITRLLVYDPTHFDGSANKVNGPRYDYFIEINEESMRNILAQGMNWADSWVTVYNCLTELLDIEGQETMRITINCLLPITYLDLSNPGWWDNYYEEPPNVSVD